MQREQLARWVLCFYIYCFLGWVWETCYVSIRKGKFVNRGFMKGPLLPIYGSGALCILFASEPFKGNWGLMALAGMVMATVLEYVTGAVMEGIFQVRYWDYSNDFWNIKGYVCLKSMLCWGAMTLLVVYGVHPHIMAWVEKLRENVVHMLGTVITMLAAVDFSISFKDAWDFRTLLIRAEKMWEEIRVLQLHLEELEDKWKERTREVILEETTRTKETFLGKAELAKKVFQGKAELAKEVFQGKAELAKEVFQEKAELAKEVFQGKAELAKEVFQEKAEQAKETLQENSDQRKVQLQAELQELFARKAAFQESLRSGYYRGVHGILRRNPGVSWKRHPEILDDMKKLFREYRNGRKERQRRWRL